MADVDELQGLAMGCMGMSMADFEKCTPAEFRAVYDAWARRAQMAERGEWERLRMMCMCMLQPYSKGALKAGDVMRFPWDDEAEAEADDPAPADETAEDVKARFEAAKARYGLC